MQPLTPHRPLPAQHPISTLKVATDCLEKLQERIVAKRQEVCDLGVRFSQAKADLTALLKDEQKIRKDQDEALEALSRQASQEPRVTSASSSSRPVSPPTSRKRPLPTVLD